MGNSASWPSEIPKLPARGIKIVLLGGGHSNVQVLKSIAEHFGPMGIVNKSLEMILINDTEYAYYSGMLPGAVAQFYKEDQIKINLQKLCDWGGAKFINVAAVSVDHIRQSVKLQNEEEIKYDLLSVDIGSCTSGSEISGVKEFAIATRPLATLLSRINKFEEEYSKNHSKDYSKMQVIVVGAGAAGVELSFSLKRRYNCRVSIISSGDTILPSIEPNVANAVIQKLKEVGINFVLHATVRQVFQNRIQTEAGEYSFDLLVWAAGAAPHILLKNSSFALSNCGYIRVKNTLQTISSDKIFASGDCCTMENYPWVPKAGVYAVREGPIVATNICKYIHGQPLVEYEPQKSFMALLNAGDGTAIGRYKSFCMQGGWVMTLKDKIDVAFMNRFDTSLLDPSPVT